MSGAGLGAGLNPALPLLALLTAAGPVLAGGLGRSDRRRAAALAPGAPRQPWRELGMAWALLGLAGMALLAPALALPGGIPSPAGSLAGLAPWAGAAAAEERGSGGLAAGRAAAAAGVQGNPLLRDVTFQIQPWLMFARQELRAGRLPGWNPYQFAGAPFWANGQSAVLFPLHLLFAALPLGLGFCVLPWLRVVIGGCGVWMLGRELGLGLPGAALAAVSFALSGMLVSFALFPMGNALALVPWVVWAVERVAATAGDGGRVRLQAAAALGAAAGLQLLAGHPETAAHSALLTFLYLAVRGAARPAAAWLGWCGGWLAGAALAAVQLAPLAAVLPDTARWQAAGAGNEPPFSLLLAQPLRLVLPELYGHPARGTWWGPFNYSATAVYVGALALPFAAAGLARCRRDRRWLAVGVAAAFAFAAAYHWPGLRDLLGALPVLGRAAHHRLIFGVELGAALLAGAGCDEWLAGRGRGLLVGAAGALLMLAAAWALYRADWTAHGLVGREAAWTAGVAAVALAAALSLRLTAGRRFLVAPLLPALVLCDLLLAHGAINPPLPLARLYPATGAVRFLAGMPGRVAGAGEALRPDTAMVYGLSDLRGDDPVKLARFESAYGSLATPDAVYFQPVHRWDSAWLDPLGVRWVLTGPAEPPAATGWRLAYAGPDARVYERPSALPLVRWGGAPRLAGAAPAGVAGTVPARESAGGSVGAPRAPAAAGAREAADVRRAAEDLPAAGGPGGAAVMGAVAGGRPDGADVVAGGRPGGADVVAGGRPGGADALRTTQQVPGRWGIEWRTAAARTLVVAETWDRGWSAAVDGHAVPVKRVDGLLMGVGVGPGAGRLELRYRPPGFVGGAAVSGLMLALLLGAAALAARSGAAREAPVLAGAAGDVRTGR